MKALVLVAGLAAVLHSWYFFEPDAGLAGLAFLSLWIAAPWLVLAASLPALTPPAVLVVMASYVAISVPLYRSVDDSSTGPLAMLYLPILTVTALGVAKLADGAVARLRSR